MANGTDVNRPDVIDDERFICDSLDIDMKALTDCVGGRGRSKLDKKLAAYEYKSFLTGYIKLLNKVAEGDERAAKAYAEYREILFPEVKEAADAPRGGVIILPPVRGQATGDRGQGIGANG